jgi:hypothetical protein
MCDVAGAAFVERRIVLRETRIVCVATSKVP